MEYDEYEYLRDSALAGMWMIEVEESLKAEINMEIRVRVKEVLRTKRRKVFLSKKAYIWKKKVEYEAKTPALC